MCIGVDQGNIRPGFEGGHHAFEGVALVAIIGIGVGDILRSINK
jgi:hypothetical protein